MQQDTRYPNGFNNTPYDDGEEVHLADYLNVILRRRKIFAAAFAAVFIGVALFTFTMKPVYEASATLHVKDEKGKGGLLGDLAMLNSANPVDAEIEILKSRTNAEEVVKRLHLNWLVKKAGSVRFSLMDFSSTSVEPVYDVEITGANTFTVTPREGGEKLSGTSGVLLQGKGLTLLIRDLQGKPGDTFRLTLAPFNATVESLRKNIKAAEVGKKTNIIKVSYTNTDREKASEVVNTLVQAYLDQTIAFKTEEASRTVKFVDEQIKGVRDELDTSEKNLQAYKSTSGVVKLDTEAEELVKKLSDVDKERAAVGLQRKQVEFALNALQEARKRGAVYSPAVMREDPLIAGMATKLTELEVQKRALVSENTESHPQVKALQASIDALQKKIQATYETALKNLAKQESSVNQQIGQYEGHLRKLPAAERDLARLMRVSKVNSDIYMFLLQKHEEARIVKASTISNINIVDPAIVPDKPVRPQKAKNLILGLLVGLMFGVGGAFFQDYLDDTIKDEEDAKKRLGLPLLAIVPFIPQQDNESIKDIGRTMITHFEPRAVVSESFRSLRTAIHFSGMNRQKRCLLVTSSFPGEGKSIVVTNLAITMAQAGVKTLVVDCDMRRPSLHDKFGQAQFPGLSELVAGDHAFDEVTRKTLVDNLDVISAGSTPPNPAEILGSDIFRDHLDQWKNEYDMVLLDAPPVLPVTDASILTAMSDVVIVVLEAGRVPVKAGQRMREILASVNAPVAGFVLNDKTAVMEGYGYYGRGYYGRYSRYGGGYYGDSSSEKAKTKPWWRRWM